MKDSSSQGTLIFGISYFRPSVCLSVCRPIQRLTRGLGAEGHRSSAALTWSLTYKYRGGLVVSTVGTKWFRTSSNMTLPRKTTIETSSAQAPAGAFDDFCTIANSQARLNRGKMPILGFRSC
jgi:hypothetical protein